MSTDSFLGPGYHVPQSRLRLTGSRTLSRDLSVAGGGRTSITYSSTISVELAADPETRIDIPGALGGTKRELGLTLAEDGRLQSLNIATTGMGPEILKAATTLAGTVVATLVPGRRMLSVAGDPLQELRRKIEGYVAEVREKLVDASRELALSPNRVKALEVSIMERELVRLRSELTEVEEELLAKDAASEESWTESDEEWLFLDDLPAAPAFLPGDEPNLQEFAAGLPEEQVRLMTEIVRRFGVVVCRDDAEAPEEPEAGKAPAQQVETPHQQLLNQMALRASGAVGPSLVTRAPRAVNITVYRLSAPQDGVIDLTRVEEMSLRFVSRARALVVDGRSPWVLLPLGEGALFSKDLTKARIGAAGGVVELDTSSETTLAAAVATMPEAFSAGVKSATEIAKGLGDMADADLVRRASRAEAEKKIREAAAPAPPSADAVALAKRKEDLQLRFLEARIALIEAQAQAAAGE